MNKLNNVYISISESTICDINEWWWFSSSLSLVLMIFVFDVRPNHNFHYLIHVSTELFVWHLKKISRKMIINYKHMTYEWILNLFRLSLGVAGMCSKTAVAPLDRIKILLQAHSNHYKHLGVFSGLRHIVRKESLWALYKGNSAQMVRIFPYAATQFTAFEFYKRVSRK